MSEWFEEAEEYLIPVYDRLPVSFERGAGALLYDEAGNRYLDALAGIAVNILGYRHPYLVETAEKAANDIYHVSNLFHIKEQFKLARRLSGISFEAAAFFCNSGAEANEAAIKFVRRFSQRRGSGGREILTFQNSFHGRTLGALAATGQEKYRAGFEPLPEGFDYVPYNDLEALEARINSDTCALLMEPVQGEGGVIPAAPAYFEGVREICTANDVLLVLDEVQTGMGRSGEFFCHQHYDLQPDLVTLAKGLGGGVPIGALLVRRELKEAGLQSGEHASTFGGNPFVCKMALAVLEAIEVEDILANVRRQSKRLQTGLVDLVGKYQFVEAERGIGLMQALVLADSVDASKAMNKARENGLIVGIAGDNCLRFVPPLIIDETQVDELLDKLNTTLDTLSP